MKPPSGKRCRLKSALATIPICLAWGFAQAAPLGDPGTVASYELLADVAERPVFERDNRLTVVSAQMQLGPGVDVPERGRFQWCGLNWTRLNGQQYQLWMLLDRWPTLDADPVVLHYLWREPDWPDAVGFVHEVTGQAMLPRISLWKHGWPQHAATGEANRRTPVAGIPEQILFQGWPFHRTALEQVKNLAVPTNWTTVRLNPDLLIGWIAGDRDVDGRPYYRLPGGTYQYKPNTEEDLLAHARAGANFYTSKALPEWLTRSSVFRSTQQTKFSDWPADLYRPNYWGHRNHIDEPGVMILGLDSRKPAEVVERLQKTVRNALRPKDEETRSFMDVRVDSRFGRGNLSIMEEDYPTWEVFFDNAWYQLAVPGLGGIVDQDTKMFGPGTMVEAYNMAFGTHIPPTTENSCAIRVALMRGAARNFNKKWGVGLYDPDGFKLRSGKVAYFYDKGATYFWTWTGWVGLGDNSGLPYPYQRQYFSLIRQAFERNSQRDMQALLRAARVAVVIPYGYTFSPTPLNRIYWLHLERVNEQGVTYRQVLANAATEVERLLRSGIEFDLAVDDPRFTAQGYEELIYVQEDGRVRIVRPGQADQWLDAARPVGRPDLGLMPQLSIQVVGDIPAAGGKVKVRAEARPGTGDWHGEATQPIVNWEVYDNERLVPITDFAIFPVRGRELSFRAEKPGWYLLRAATVDVFGRPAVAYQSLTVKVAPE
jgi:hypothetical protein